MTKSKSLACLNLAQHQGQVNGTPIEAHRGRAGDAWVARGGDGGDVGDNLGCGGAHGDGVGDGDAGCRGERARPAQSGGVGVGEGAGGGDQGAGDVGQARRRAIRMAPLEGDGTVSVRAWVVVSGAPRSPMVTV